MRYMEGASPHDRDISPQEFFFHLVVAVELTAQYLNKKLLCPFKITDTKLKTRVIVRLAEDDTDGRLLKELHSIVGGAKQADLLDSNHGLLYRIWIYRHHVTHRGKIPWNFVKEAESGTYKLTSINKRPVNRFTKVQFRLNEFVVSKLVRSGCQSPSPDEETPEDDVIAYLSLDTANPGSGRSKIRVEDDLQRMWNYVNSRCDAILNSSPPVG